jgi:outer membrane protein TolC
VEVAARRIDAAKAQFLPNVSVTALIGFAAQSSANLFSLANRQYQIAPAFNLPIFDAGRLRAGLAEQDALYDQAVAHYNKTLISALGEVAEHLDAMQSLRRQINIQRHVMALAQASWDIAKQRYRSGVGSYLEVLSAQQPLLDAEQKAATLNAEQIDLSVRLIGALGGGFRTEQQSPVAATGESTSNSSFKELP